MVGWAKLKKRGKTHTRKNNLIALKNIHAHRGTHKNDEISTLKKIAAQQTGATKNSCSLRISYLRLGQIRLMEKWKILVTKFWRNMKIRQSRRHAQVRVLT